jgi:hypothetical protein
MIRLKLSLFHYIHKNVGKTVVRRADTGAQLLLTKSLATEEERKVLRTKVR